MCREDNDLMITVESNTEHKSLTRILCVPAFCCIITKYCFSVFSFDFGTVSRLQTNTRVNRVHIAKDNQSCVLLPCCTNKRFVGKLFKTTESQWRHLRIGVIQYAQFSSIFAGSSSVVNELKQPERLFKVTLRKYCYNKTTCWE